MRAFAICCVALFAFSLHAATTLEVSLPAQATTGIALNFTVTARDGAVTDTAYTGTVHFTSNEATATLPADYTFVPADNGAHTFSLTFHRSDNTNAHATYLVTARDVANNTIAGSNASEVYWDAGVVRHLTLDTAGTITRTVPFDVVVTAMNAYGAVITNYTGSAHFKYTSGVVPPPDYTFTLGDNGTHTFSATANDGGYNIITVEDVSDGSVSGGEGFTVTCPELVVNAGNTGALCPGGNTLIYASSNQGSIDYAWAGPPRGTYYGSAETTHVSRAGIYTVTGYSTASHCSSNAQTEVTMKNVTPASVSPSSSTICPGGHVTLTLTNAASFTDEQWQASNSTIVSGQGTSTIELEAGNYPNTDIDVFLARIDTASGCPINDHVASVHIGNVIADINTPAASCPRTTLVASVADAGPSATYAWSVANGTIANGQGTRQLAYRGDDTGTVTVNVTVTTASCTATDSAAVSVNGPTATVSGDFALCAGGEATIPVTLAGTPPFRILWSDGVVQENVTTTSTTRTLTATESATYSIAQITDASCTGIPSGAAEVSVQDAPSISEQPRGGSISRGSTATLSVIATGQSLRYDWYRGNAGDRTIVVQSGAAAAYTTPQLTETTRYWVDIVSACGATASHTATLAVSNRHRSARH